MPHGAAECNPLGDVLVDRQLSMAALARLYLQAVAADGLLSGADRNLIWEMEDRTPDTSSSRDISSGTGTRRSNHPRRSHHNRHAEHTDRSRHTSPS